MALRQVTRRHLGFWGAPFAALAILAACFDESTYQGGGRRDIGGKILQGDAGEEGDDAGTSAPADAGGTPVVDASPRDAGDGG